VAPLSPTEFSGEPVFRKLTIRLYCFSQPSRFAVRSFGKLRMCGGRKLRDRVEIRLVFLPHNTNASDPSFVQSSATGFELLEIEDRPTASARVSASRKLRSHRNVAVQVLALPPDRPKTVAGTEGETDRMMEIHRRVLLKLQQKLETKCPATQAKNSKTR